MRTRQCIASIICWKIFITISDYKILYLLRCLGVLCEQQWLYVSVPLPALWIWVFSWNASPKWYQLYRNCRPWQGSVSFWQWRPCLWYQSDGNPMSSINNQSNYWLYFEYLWWSLSYWCCVMSLQSNNTHFIYQNSIQSNLPTGVITREGWVNVVFSCSYPLIQTLSMPMGIQAEQR